jgi:trimeric autotransporter adhesin
MSTKTTTQAHRACSSCSLGLGVVSSVAPANAATVYTTSISVTTDKAPVAGANGTSVTHTLRFSTSTTAATTVEPNVILTDKPSTSALVYQAENSTTAVASGKYEVDDSAADTTDGADANGVNLTTASETGYTYYQGKVYLHARYDVPGTYTWTVFDDQGTDDGVYNGTDYGYSFTVVVAGPSTTGSFSATTTAWGTSTATGTTISDHNAGSLVRILLKDAAGNAASPDTAGGVKVTVSGSALVAAVNDDFSVTDSATYVLGNGDFNGSGYAWVNVVNGTAETVTLTLSGSGSMASTFTAPASVALTFAAAVPSTADPLFSAGSATGLKVATDMAAGTAGVATANKALSSALTFQTGKSAATPAKKDTATIADTSGKITGKSGANYTLLVTESDSDSALTYNGTFTVTPVWGSLADQSFRIYNADDDYITVTSATAAATTATVLSADNFKALNGAKASFTVEVTDQFGAAVVGNAVSASIAGRNVLVAVPSAITNADGVATLSYTDASTSTTSLADTITFTAASGVTDSATVTYSSAANLGVSTISLVTPSETTAGTVNTPIVYSAIKAGDGAEAGIVSVTATVKDANGVVLAGVPVTFTVSGTGAAVLSTYATVYTGSTGTATSKVYAWVAGTYTVTATSGTVTDTAVSSWSQANGDYSRTVSVAKGAGNGSVVATVKDRFGNPVSGVILTATRTGSGSFGGASSINGTTGEDGTVEFLLQDGSATVKVAFSSATYGQSDALATLIDGTTATNVFTAYAAGDALTAEEGVGSTYSAAGVNSASVDVANDSTQAAADAAAEATDAANAATDAANAAAEAADAATAAAQDAADAVAALSTQVSEMVNALKKQITALTNLVIKIQKKVKA